jgi:hypothetical protein
MKPVLISLLCLVAHYSYGQNYQCLQYGTDRFFLNEVVREVHIDSMSVAGNETTFTLFRSPRGNYSLSGSLYIPLGSTALKKEGIGRTPDGKCVDSVT